MGTVPSSLSTSTAALNQPLASGNGNLHSQFGPGYHTYSHSKGSMNLGDRINKSQLVINTDQMNNRFELLIKEKNMKQLSEYIKVNSSNVALATAAVAVAATGVTLNDPLAAKALNELGIRQHRSNSYCFSSSAHKRELRAADADDDEDLDGGEEADASDESDEYERNFNNEVDKVRNSMYANCDEFDEYEADLNEQPVLQQPPSQSQQQQQHPLAKTESLNDDEDEEEENVDSEAKDNDEAANEDDTEFDMTTTTLSLNTTSTSKRLQAGKQQVGGIEREPAVANLVNESGSGQAEPDRPKSDADHIEYFSLKPVLMTTYQYKASSPDPATEKDCAKNCSVSLISSDLSSIFTSSHAQQSAPKAAAASVSAPSAVTTTASSNCSSSSSSSNTSSSGCSSGLSSNSSSSSSSRRYHRRLSNGQQQQQQQLNLEASRIANQSIAVQANNFREPVSRQSVTVAPGQEMLVLRQQPQQQHGKVIAPVVDVASASACLFLNNKMSNGSASTAPYHQPKMLFLSTTSSSSLVQSPISLSASPSPIFGPLSSNESNATSHFSSSSTTSASASSAASSAKKSINRQPTTTASVSTPDSELSLNLASGKTSLRAKINKKLRLSKSGILTTKEPSVEIADASAKTPEPAEPSKMRKKISSNSLSTLFLNKLGIHLRKPSAKAEEPSSTRAINRHSDKERMKTKSECIFSAKESSLGPESGKKSSASSAVPSKSLYFSHDLDKEDDEDDEDEDEEVDFRGSSIIESHEKTSSSGAVSSAAAAGVFKSNPNLTEAKSSGHKKGFDGIKRFRKGLNKKLAKKFQSVKSSSTKHVDEASSSSGGAGSKKSLGKASTPSHRDSGIIADIFSNIGSMNNIKSKLSSAKSSLRNSLSVFSLKASTSGNLHGIDLGTGTVTGASSSSSKSASLVSAKKKSSDAKSHASVGRESSTFTCSSVNNFEHASMMINEDAPLGAGSAASSSTRHHHHHHHHHHSFTSSTHSSTNSTRLDSAAAKEAPIDRIQHANQKFDAGCINSKSMNNLNKYSIYSTKSNASTSSSSAKSSVLSSALSSSMSSSSSSTSSSREAAIGCKDERTSRAAAPARNHDDEDDNEEEEEDDADVEENEDEGAERVDDADAATAASSASAGFNEEQAGENVDRNTETLNNAIRGGGSEEFEIKIQNENDKAQRERRNDEFILIKNKLNEINFGSKHKCVDESGMIDEQASAATRYFNNQMHNKFKQSLLQQQQQQQQQASSSSSSAKTAAVLNASGSYYTYLPRTKASLQVLGQQQSKSFKVQDLRAGNENASLRRTTTFHSTKPTNPTPLFESSSKYLSVDEPGKNAAARPATAATTSSVLTSRVNSTSGVNCNCNQCKKDVCKPAGAAAINQQHSLASRPSVSSTANGPLSSILKHSSQNVAAPQQQQQRINADHFRPKNYGSFASASSGNTYNLSALNVNTLNRSNGRSSPSKAAAAVAQPQAPALPQFVQPSSKFTSSKSSTTLFTTLNSRPHVSSYDKTENQSMVSSLSSSAKTTPSDSSDSSHQQKQPEPAAKANEITTTIRMTSSAKSEAEPSGAAANMFNTRHQKVVVQASTSDLLRCFATFISHRCAHLIRSSSESSHHHHRSFSKFDPRDTIIWLRSADRALLVQGWQEIAFMNPVNVVFVYLLVRESLKPSEIKTVYDLQCNIMACLYLAFSYMGNEISYPLKPFIIEENRDIFWQRTVTLMNQLSGCMLKINQDPRFFTELFYELRSYSNVSLLTPSKTTLSIAANTALNSLSSFSKKTHSNESDAGKHLAKASTPSTTTPSETHISILDQSASAKDQQAPATTSSSSSSSVSTSSNSSQQQNGGAPPAYTSSAPVAVSYSLSTSSIAAKLASSQPFHQQLKLSTFTFNTKQQQMASSSSGNASTGSAAAATTTAAAPSTEIRYRQFNQLYNQFNRPDVLSQLN